MWIRKSFKNSIDIINIKRWIVISIQGENNKHQNKSSFKNRLIKRVDEKRRASIVGIIILIIKHCETIYMDWAYVAKKI